MSPATLFAYLDPRVIELAGVLLFTLGLLAFTFLTLRAPDSLPFRLWTRYVTFLESKLRLMFLRTSGRNIALAQVGAIVALIAVRIVASPSWIWIAMGVVAVLPSIAIERMRKKRKVAIEAQLNGFTMSLANALKATPSLGAAFQTMADLTAEPMKSELSYAVKAMRFGASLDQALLLMAGRIAVPDLDVIVSSLLIGRNVGGDLPTILESTAHSLREMTRLEQLVRAKTAEGKAQLWVLAVFPLFLVFGLASLMPNYFDVLTASFAGYVLAFLSAAFWGGSIVLARKIVNVAI
jgi:tight adherence protein B